LATASVTTFSSDTETVTRTKLNGLAANLLTQFNGNVDIDNIAAAGLLQTTTSAALILGNSGSGPHLRFTGDPTVASPTDGDLWFDGTNLKLRIGATTHNIDTTAA